MQEASEIGITGDELFRAGVGKNTRDGRLESGPDYT
jgi:hypothetical protein